MKRINIHLTDEQIKSLDQLADKTGLTVAEHIRRSVDKYLKEELMDEFYKSNSLDFIKVRHAIFMNFIKPNSPIKEEDITSDDCIKLIKDAAETLTRQRFDLRKSEPLQITD